MNCPKKDGTPLLIQKSHGLSIGPTSKSCLNSSKCDQSRALSSIRSSRAPPKLIKCQWKWALWGYGDLPFNNPLSQSGEGKETTKLYLGASGRFYQPIGQLVTNELTCATKRNQQEQVHSARQHLWTVQS